MVDPAPPAVSRTAPLVDSADGAVAEPSYHLEQLLPVAGEHLGEEITSRTVRLYATQGLIDRPAKERRIAVYGRRHLLQLMFIRALARRGLSLAAIATLICLTDGELEHQFNQLEAEAPHTHATERDSALDNLCSLRASTSGSAETAPRDPEFAERSASLLLLLGSPLSTLSPSSGSRPGCNVSPPA